ncbi:hypothetical protein STTU_p0100 (plasmid) [Streptomyces sp. Tu6071]|nr:hypothetical protein STTU_p0100 [Streptomyces sp. Tu6071]
MDASTEGSPRPRGRRSLHLGGQTVARRIPAPAGTTGGQRLVPPPGQKDPRARGDDDVQIITFKRISEGSPRPRGRLVAEADEEVEDRRIPAPAGTTAHVPASPAAQEEGSPRPRGRPPFGGTARRACRRIPAPAGTTSGRQMPRSRPRKDPRARGDDDPGLPEHDAPPEGSPRPRGRPGRDEGFTLIKVKDPRARGDDSRDSAA